MVKLNKLLLISGSRFRFTLLISTLCLILTSFIVFDARSSKAFVSLVTRLAKPVTSSTVQTRIVYHPAVSALKVIQESSLGGDLQLELQNTSDKPIAAFVITAYDRSTKQEGTTHRLDYAFADDEARGSIAPGQKVNFQGSFGGDVNDNEFILRAVVFADGSFKGDFSAVQQVFDYRRGQRAPFVVYTQELARTITRLNNRVANRMALRSPTADFIRTTIKPELDRIRAAVRNLPPMTEAGQNETTIYKSAMQFGQAHLKRELEELDEAEATQDLPTLWGRIKFSEERWRKFCARMQVGGEQR